MAEEQVDALVLAARFDQTGIEAQARDALSAVAKAVKGSDIPPLNIDTTELLAKLKETGLDASEFFAGMKEEAQNLSGSLPHAFEETGKASEDMGHAFEESRAGGRRLESALSALALETAGVQGPIAR